MEVTELFINILVNVLLLLTAQVQDSYCAQEADFPHLDPNRLQFFEYESISLNCTGLHDTTEWKVMKKIPSNSTQWATSTGSLNIKPAYASHSGEYWCENGEGERSNALNITVTAGDVILESPALPVMDQQTITLRCRDKATSTKLPADFYKDGHFSGTGYTSEMTIHNVSKSSEGFYKCAISGLKGESPESWLAVRDITPSPQNTTPHDDQGTRDDQKTAPHVPHPGSIELSILLPVVFSILCVAVLLLVVGVLHCRKHRVSGKPNVADTNNTTYAVVAKQRKERGCQEANVVDHMDDVTYAVVSTKSKARVSGKPNVADTNNTTYAVVAKQRKERVSGKPNVADTNNTTYAVVAKQRKERGH